MGTWNVLHPKYERAPEISARLLEGNLDIYLLQEVGEEQLADQMAPNSTLAAMYEAVHTLHPGKGASGWAILLRRARLCIEGRDHVDIVSVEKGPHEPHSLLVGARDVETGAQVPKVNSLYVDSLRKPHNRASFLGRCESVLLNGPRLEANKWTTLMRVVHLVAVRQVHSSYSHDDCLNLPRLSQDRICERDLPGCLMQPGGCILADCRRT